MTDEKICTLSEIETAYKQAREEVNKQTRRTTYFILSYVGLFILGLCIGVELVRRGIVPL